MAKGKAQNSVANRHIYSRASYLYQAASYLAQVQEPKQQATSSKNESHNPQHSTTSDTALEKKAVQNTSRQMISDMRAVTLKLLIRQSPDLKRTICKFCDSLLVEGKTCHSTIENPSKGGKKPWADLLVIQCLTCHNAKRFPISSKRQKKRHQREKMELAERPCQSREDT